jgi:hypothetical protein
LPCTTSPGARVATNEYSCPHFGQKPESRLRAASHDEQKRRRSGTCGAIKAASGSCGGRGGRASGRPPSERLAERDDRVEPDLVERALRAERVDGVRPEPVRVDAARADPLVAVVVVVAVGPTGAIPQVSQ